MSAGSHGALLADLAWLDSAMSARFAAHIAGPDAPAVLPVPPAIRGTSPYAKFLRAASLAPPARLILALAVAPHIAPELLDPFLLQNQAIGRRFSEFGGLTGQSHAGFLPTAETALFLLAGNDRALRLTLLPYVIPNHQLYTSGPLLLETRHPDEPPLAAALRPSAAGLHLLLTGSVEPPPPGPDFPASRITTRLGWQDLVLDDTTRSQVEHIGLWLRFGPTIMQGWDLGRRLKPGYRCLFYGPPGTGKTLTACLLGQRHKLPVFRVDLSRIISKWIGETEKNLAALFDRAQNANLILFFDEAEALFGQRTESHTANDRAANQQISYLLQRLEDFNGLVILATNQRAHMDEAFSRRFQSSIRFPMPDEHARAKLWAESFRNPGFTLAPDVDFSALANRHELSGGAIINVLRYTALVAAGRPRPVVEAADLMEGIRQELQKEGQYLTR
jgi:hypothetical protein